MKTIFSIITLLVGLTTCFLFLNASNPVPQLEIDNRSIDLGVISKNDTVVAIRKITNLGNKPLHIIASQASCECTISDLQAGEVLSPGSSRNFKIKYISSDTGTFKRSLVIRSDSKEMFSSIQIKGRVTE